MVVIIANVRVICSLGHGLCTFTVVITFGWGKGGNISSVGWQVTLCDPIWHVSSRNGVAKLAMLHFELL